MYLGYITLGTGHHHSQHHPLNFRSLQGLEQNGKQKAQLSPTNSNSDHSSTTTTSNKKCMNCNGGTSSPSTASTTSTGKVSHDMSHIYLPNFRVNLSFNSRVRINKCKTDPYILQNFQCTTMFIFRLFPIISISQKFFSIFFLTLEKIGIDEKVICYHNISN